MAKEITDAIILDVMDYRETSRFITVFTERFGKLTLIAKGVRKTNSSMTGRLEPFTHGTIHFYLQENKTLYLLSDFQPLMFPTIIRSSYERIVAAFLVTEISQKITAEFQQNQQFYKLLSTTLAMINNKNTRNLNDILRIFELKSITLHGYQPELDSCNHCHKHKLKFTYFSASRGGVICNNCGPSIKGKVSLSPGTLNFIHKVSQIDINKIGSLHASKKVNNELLAINISIFQYYFEREFQGLKMLPKT